MGDKKLRRELGDDYVKALFKRFGSRVAPSSDLCCYWFYKACEHIAAHNSRVGLVATQSISGGNNQATLGAISSIFFAISDKEWVLDGANLRISLIGFDGGKQKEKYLDGQAVDQIFSNLTSTVNVSLAQKLLANKSIAFMGDTKGGSFDIVGAEAANLLTAPNPHNLPNSDVLVPWINGLDVVRRPRDMWIVDFGVSMNEEDASLYEHPFFKIESLVKNERQKNKRETYKKFWWRHVEPRPSLIEAIDSLDRFLVTVAVAKHQVFCWSSNPILADHSLFVFARSDDYFLGILHSKIHKVWSLRMGTSLDDRPRYTPTTCFETFPFPAPTPEQKRVISEAAARLNQLRENWLNPPEWMKEETIEFRATENGPWHRYLVPDSVGANGIGLARWTRLVAERPNRPVQDFRYDPKMKQFRNFAVTTSDALSHRTLTNLYNHPPAWLLTAHRKLDEAVFASYGWGAEMSDDEILERLLALNLERARQESEPSYSSDEWRDAVGFHIVRRHRQEATFGRVKLQKLFFLAEATYQLPLAGEYARAALGPLDSKMIYPFEERAQEKGWLRVHRRSGGDVSGINYELGENAEAAAEWSREILGDAAQQLDELLDLLNGCNTETAEKVATLYAAWNDLLLQGQPATEKAILDEVLDNWHPNKQNIPRTIWRNALDWMKRERLVPKGQGVATSKSNE